MARKPKRKARAGGVPSCRNWLPLAEPMQVVSKRLRARITGGWIAMGGKSNNRSEVSRNRGDVLTISTCQRRERDRRRTAQSVVQSCSERIDVSALVRYALALLGGHIGRGSKNGPTRGHATRCRWHTRIVSGIRGWLSQVLGQSPVHDDGFAEVANDDIRGFQVSVDDSLGVRV